MTNRNIPKISALKLDNFMHLVKMNEYYINEFCLEYKIDDITKISENRFKAALTYINNNYFRLSKYTDKKRAPAIDTVIDYTDILQLDAILKSYIYLCQVCDKIPSINGFSLYTGISTFIMYRWRDNAANIDIYNTDNSDNIINPIDIYNSINNNLNNINTNNTIISDYDYINSIKNINDYSVYKKQLDIFRGTIINILKDNNENALADRLSTSGSGSPVGIIAVLNHRHGWTNNAPQTVINNPVISISDLPQLTDGGGVD